MSNTGKSRFALFFGNRGFFPGSLIQSARDEVSKRLKELGHDTIELNASLTRYGAVETPAEGKIYADFLEENKGKYDGIILSLPNFGDENGAVAALANAGVPIYIQAYPDEMTRMAPEVRRDAFCGKFSIMDVFYQNGIKFTALKPHTVAPASKAFASNIDHFDRVCHVVKGFKNLTVGAIGARTTAFKTVRFDELALQRHGITVETYDLSDVFDRMKSVDINGDAYKHKVEVLGNYADFSQVPQDASDKLIRLGVVLDEIVEEAALDALALRCWIEMQKILGISPCVILSEMNNRGIAAACELDIGNAVSMHALHCASGDVAACLDWNNNYGEDDNKCILFHCGPVPQSMMTTRGTVTNHAILENAVGPGCSYGCNVGRIAASPFTFASMMTEAGKLRFYAGEGRFTEDFIPADFFGCAGVAEVAELQDVLLHVGMNGHRHHVSVTPQHVLASLAEALEHYLGFEVSRPQL